MVFFAFAIADVPVLIVVASDGSDADADVVVVGSSALLHHFAGVSRVALANIIGLNGGVGGTL